MLSFSGLPLRASSIALAGCLAAALTLHAPEASAAKIKMAFPGPPTTFSLPLYVAQKKGFLGDLEVEEVNVTGDSNAMRALVSGNADIAFIGMVNVLAAIQSGANVRAINTWQPIGDYSLVLATGKGTAIADLAGKTFATSGPGALPDQLARLILKKYNIDDSTAHFVQVGGHAARLQAVIAGRADASLINTVTTLRGVNDGKVIVLTKLSKEFPGLGYSWNVVRTDELDNPQLSAALQTMTEASIRAVRYIIANPDEAAEIFHERIPELDVAFLKAVVHDLNGENLWGVDGGLDPAVEQYTADLNVKLGNLTAAPAPKDVLDPRFVDVALKKLGPYEKK
ncbi:MAG TPA: ABC transporter substrate-binding protein [Xanthobacteraceae bacterium]|nr:ABC transporter substrate-binding protein [Xanthobacteraceae bacterium]